jgi:hypothetical protein
VSREWIEALQHPQQDTLETQIYGDRTFEPLQYHDACQAKRLWGYECPFVREPSAADHLYPHSLGGPTIAENRLTLCRWHNTAKSMDIHDFPFEEGLPSWVVPTLGMMERWIRFWQPAG